jgi:hypothetical protein
MWSTWHPGCGPTHPTTGRDTSCRVGRAPHPTVSGREAHSACRCWGPRTTRLAQRPAMPHRCGVGPSPSSVCSMGAPAICRCHQHLGSIPRDGISGGIGYSSWYITHVSSIVRLRGLCWPPRHLPRLGFASVIRVPVALINARQCGRAEACKGLFNAGVGKEAGGAH